MILSIAQLWRVTSLAKATGHSTLPQDICPDKEKIDWMEMELPEETVEGSDRTPEEKSTSSDHRGQSSLISCTLLPQVTQHCWIKLGEMGDGGARSNFFFFKGTCTVNNSCKGSLVY